MWGLHPEGLGENANTRVDKMAHGERKRNGRVLSFQVPLWDESWSKVFGRLPCFSLLVS